MSSRIKATIRSDQTASSNIDRTSVYKYSIEVEKYLRAKSNIRPVVRAHRTFDPRIFCKQLVIFFLRGCRWWKTAMVLCDSVEEREDVSSNSIADRSMDIFERTRRFSSHRIWKTHSLHSSTVRRRDISSAVLKR